jgi:single-stranded-DNA-specific exonuclease
VGNPEPLFLSHGVEVAERRLFSGGARHRLRQGNQIMTGVSFGVGENFGLAPGSKVDLAYRLGENEWNGTKSVELKIVDWRPRQGSQGG